MTNRQSRCLLIQGLAHADQRRYEKATATLGIALELAQTAENDDLVTTIEEALEAVKKS